MNLKWYLTIITITAIWTSIHLVYPNLFFDADQAVIGIMGNDLSDGRFFPWTYYGQKYMLAVEAWFASLSFLILGVSTFSLKFPLAVLHVFTAVIVFKLIRIETKLPSLIAALISSPLLMPNPAIGAYLMGSNGGNAWPAFYILVIWILRNKKITLGFWLGFTYFHREFILFGAVALFFLDAIELISNKFQLHVNQNRWRDFAKSKLITIIIANFTYHSLVGLGALNENFWGAGRPKSEWLGLHHIWENVKFTTQNFLATALGISSDPVSRFEVNSKAIGQPASWAFLNAILLTICLIFSFKIMLNKKFKSHFNENKFFYFLFLSALIQFCVMTITIQTREYVLLRYFLLGPLMTVGLLGLVLNNAKQRVEFIKISSPQYLATLTAMSLFLANLYAQVSVAHDRFSNPWTDPRNIYLNALQARGFKFGWADYWDSYHIDFLSNEKLIIASSDHTRVKRYRDEVIKHQSEAFVLTKNAGECIANQIQIHDRIICPFDSFKGDIPAITKNR